MDSQFEHSHSLGILIEWKHYWGMPVDITELDSHSLGILIEWKQQAIAIYDICICWFKFPLAGDIN